MKKQKKTRERPTQGRGATFIITEMAVFTLEKDYSCETGLRYHLPSSTRLALIGASAFAFNKYPHKPYIF